MKRFTSQRRTPTTISTSQSWIRGISSPFYSQTPGEPGTLCRAPSGQHVNDDNYQRYNQQNVDQATGNVKAESKKPENQTDSDNRPKHMHHLRIGSTGG